MFDGVSVSYEYFVPSFVYIRFRMIFRWDMCADSTIKYLDMLKVLPDFYPNFFGNNDCFICYTSY